MKKECASMARARLAQNTSSHDLSLLKKEKKTLAEEI
jgi:hypothetical protein